MKKLIFSLMMMAFGVVGYAADHAYIPLVEEGKTWHYIFPNDPEGKWSCTLSMKGDTVIDGLTYKKVFFADGKLTDMPWPMAYMHEADKIVTAKSNAAALKWLSTPGRSYHYPAEFSFIDDLRMDFNDYSAPDYTDVSFRMPENSTKEMIEDESEGITRTAAYWWGEGTPRLNKFIFEVWVVEGIGIEGDGVHLLKSKLIQPMWSGSYHILGDLKEVTNAQGEVIYKGHFVREDPAAVRDVRPSAAVVDEAYYNVNGARLSAPSGGVVIKVTRYSDGAVKATKQIHRR